MCVCVCVFTGAAEEEGTVFGGFRLLLFRLFSALSLFTTFRSFMNKKKSCQAYLCDESPYSGEDVGGASKLTVILVIETHDFTQYH